LLIIGVYENVNAFFNGVYGTLKFVVKRDSKNSEFYLLF